MADLSQASRILIINQNWMGDVLFSTPAIRAIRKKYPNAFLGCLAPARAADVLRRNPHLNEVLVYRERWSLTGILEPAKLYLALRRKRYDAVFFFHRSRSKALLTKLCGIPYRLGYHRGGKKRHLTHPVPEPARPMHKVDYFLNLLAGSGIPNAGRFLEFEATAAERESLEKKMVMTGIPPSENYAVAHAGGNWDLKRWRAGHFAEWAERFTKSTQWHVILCGTPRENALCEEIVRLARTPLVVSLCGQTSLGELAALIKGAKFVLSNDSGPIHLASSQGTKILGVFGPTDPALTGPVSDRPVKIFWKDVGCKIPCYFQACDDRFCMDSIGVEEVLTASQEFAHE